MPKDLCRYSCEHKPSDECTLTSHKSIQQEQQLHTLLQNQEMFILNLTILWSDCIRIMFVCLCFFLGGGVSFFYLFIFWIVVVASAKFQVVN